MKKINETTIIPLRQEIVTQDNSINALISQAITANLDVEKMERLFVLKEKYDAQQAKEAFTRAKAKAQAEFPIIKKTKPVKNKAGQIVYYYASTDGIVSQVQKPIADNGLSYRFDEKYENDNMIVTCIVQHEMGYEEATPFQVPIGSEAYMTDVQKHGARNTFAKRYAFCNAFGIITGDEDIDATNTDKKEAEPKSSKAKIVFLLRTLGHEPKTKEGYGDVVKTLTQLNLADEKNHQEIVDRLEILKTEKETYDENNNKRN